MHWWLIECWNVGVHLQMEADERELAGADDWRSLANVTLCVHMSFSPEGPVVYILFNYKLK